jgi:hypothetical protein
MHLETLKTTEISNIPLCRSAYCSVIFVAFVFPVHGENHLVVEDLLMMANSEPAGCRRLNKQYENFICRQSTRCMLPRS